MKTILIQTIGEVSFRKNSIKNVGFRYDVPFGMGIPFIPLFKVLSEKMSIPDSISIGFARCEGYRGFVSEMGRLHAFDRRTMSFIRSEFTNSRLLPDKGYKVRSIKAGLKFRAAISIPEDLVESFSQKLTAIDQIGIQEDGISGKVSISLVDEEDYSAKKVFVNELCRYTSVDYSLLLLSPACIFAPYADGAKTEMFIPGALILDYLKKNLPAPVDYDSVICSHAYPAADGKRLLPVPICSSVVKLDKKQLRYRLSPGKNPKLVEQDVVLRNSFTDDIRKHTVRFSSPDTIKIIASDYSVYEALNSGQSFKGTIYAPEPVIKEIIRLFTSAPVVFLGTLSREGCGEAMVTINSLHEDKYPENHLVRSFDLCCISETLLINDEGMPSCTVRSLVDEVERILGMQGQFEITGKYTDLFKDYRINHNWHCDGAVTRCIARGSVIRLETKNHNPVDIGPILHTFIGEKNDEGYGEIMAYPADNDYYRLAERFIPQHYSQANFRLTNKDVVIAADAVENISTAMFKANIKALAYNDAEECSHHRLSMHDLLPLGLLSFLREKYNPIVSDQMLVDWYREGMDEQNND